MTTEKLLQNFANATGIIVDHTLQPPRALGQAFIVSKSRLVTSAGSVFNYAEAPWALSVNFPHPGIILKVKTITLHPEFDRKEARKNYLSQTATSKYSYPVQFNDLATLAVQSEIKEPEPEEIVELHKALSVPFSREGVEVSGPLKETEIVEVVKKLLASKRQGLLTIYDELNIPIAYIQLANGEIEQVYFQGIVGEMAFAELVYRQAGAGFAFQPNNNFAWGDLRKIEMPAQDLVSESIRRAHELPGILNQLGGANACYQRVVSEFSADSFNQNVQWLVNNLWRSIDGYMTVDQFSERVGADTYTLAQGLRELANHGVVSLINKASPFHLGGQLGTPIVSHTDFDINPGDALKAFYLDPISGAPCWQDGDFGGVASVLQPKNLLHSIPIYLRVPGALVLKNYRLIAVHNGPVQMKPGQSIDRPLFQMIWIGALFDMSSKKLRATTSDSEEIDQSESGAGSKYATLRERDEEEIKPTADKVQKYTCPVCFATNAKLGNCFNCGAVIDNLPPELKRQGFFIDTMPVKFISDLQEKYQLSDKKVFAILAAFLVLMLVIIVMNTSRPPQPTARLPEVVVHKDSEQAVKLAVDSVGLKATAPTGYWFEDTNSVTNPLPSFGIFSDSSNQKVVFIIFNDMSPVQALDRFTQIPPFSDVVATTPATKVTEGSQIVGEGAFHYYVYNYSTASGINKTMLIGSFPAKEVGKGVLVLGQTLNQGNYDYKSTLFLVDAMAEPLTKAANAMKLSNAAGLSSQEKPANQSDNKFASEEELNKYCELLQEKLQKRIQQSGELQDEIKKRKHSKLKIVLDLDLSSEGQLQKMEIAEPDSVQKVNDALVKIIKAGSPYENIPHVESGNCSLRVILNKNGEVKVELR